MGGNGMNWIRIAAVMGASGVAAGAFGAHGLRDKVEPRMLEVFETAVRYQMLHVPALLVVGILLMMGRSGLALQLSGWSFLVGSLIFSGSLYALVLSNVRWLGAITPIGGVFLIAGWIFLAVASGEIARTIAVEV